VAGTTTKVLRARRERKWWQNVRAEEQDKYIQLNCNHWLKVCGPSTLSSVFYHAKGSTQLACSYGRLHWNFVHPEASILMRNANMYHVNTGISQNLCKPFMVIQPAPEKVTPTRIDG
jgi:hypothetical protein